MQSRSRILVIDDDPIFRSLVVSLLRKEYLVSVATDGETGYTKAREHRPDLVIIDFQMPGWNGVSTLRAFRLDPQLSDIKVMMLTSDATKETVLSAIQAGTDEYIIKTSFNKNDFFTKIHKLLHVNANRVLMPEASAPLAQPVATEEESAAATDKETASQALNRPQPRPLSDLEALPLEEKDAERLQEIMEEWE